MCIRDRSLRVRLLVVLLALLGLLTLVGLALGVPGAGTPGTLTPDAPNYALAPGGAMLVDRDNFNGAPRDIPGIELGSHLDVLWAEINPANCETNPTGCTDFSTIEQRLRQLGQQQVTTVDGQVLSPRPLWLSLPRFWSQGNELDGIRYCNNNVPSWLGGANGLAPNYAISVTRTVNGQPLVHTEYVPRLDSGALQAAYTMLIQRLGAAFDNDPRIAGLFIAGGYDNETNLAAPWCGITLEMIANCANPASPQCLISALSLIHISEPTRPY